MTWRWSATLMSVVCLFGASSASAGVVMNATRYIYPYGTR